MRGLAPVTSFDEPLVDPASGVNHDVPRRLTQDHVVGALVAAKLDSWVLEKGTTDALHVLKTDAVLVDDPFSDECLDWRSAVLGDDRQSCRTVLLYRTVVLGTLGQGFPVVLAERNRVVDQVIGVHRR